ncbi:hypothetical protein TNCV_1585621 [Trichonephila clavipes]|nr:hypothetical protein TNCV_1585621 [Trichonephila clavipes]
MIQDYKPSSRSLTFIRPRFSCHRCPVLSSFGPFPPLSLPDPSLHIVCLVRPVASSSTTALLHPTNISLNEEIEECSEKLLQGNTGIVFQLLNAAIGSRWEKKAVMVKRPPLHLFESKRF